MFSQVLRALHLSRYRYQGVALYANWALPAGDHTSKEKVRGAAPRGAVTQVTARSERTCTEAHGTPLTTTEVTPERPLPVTVRGVPPSAVPWLGVTPVTNGVAAREYLGHGGGVGRRQQRGTCGVRV